MFKHLLKGTSCEVFLSHIHNFKKQPQQNKTNPQWVILMQAEIHYYMHDC